MTPARLRSITERMNRYLEGSASNAAKKVVRTTTVPLINEVRILWHMASAQAVHIQHITQLLHTTQEEVAELRRAAALVERTELHHCVAAHTGMVECVARVRPNTAGTVQIVGVLSNDHRKRVEIAVRELAALDLAFGDGCHSVLMDSGIASLFVDPSDENRGAWREAYRIATSARTSAPFPDGAVATLGVLKRILEGGPRAAGRL
jgi:hypothetical protein